MPIQRVQLRHKETGVVVEVGPAAVGYFPDYEPVTDDQPTQTPAPAPEQAAAKKKTAPAADTTREQ